MKKPTDPLAQKKKGAKLDANEIAFRTLQIASGDVPNPDKQKNPTKATAGRKGGTKGGMKRMDALTKAQRSELGKQAAESRWGKSEG